MNNILRHNLHPQYPDLGSGTEDMTNSGYRSNMGTRASKRNAPFVYDSWDLGVLFFFPCLLF